jgi:DNA polymerase-3 subunit beta
MTSESFSVQFDFRALKAAALCASNEETRYYLKGVFVEFNDAGLLTVATDGHRLLVARPHYSVEMPNQPHFGIIIPLDVIARLKISRNQNYGDLVCEAGAWRLAYDGLSIGFKPVDGTFPDWRRVVPREISGETAQFNPAYMVDFAKAAKAMGGDARPTIGYNGEGPALITLQADIEAFGVLMPYRASIVATTPPGWIYAKPKAEAETESQAEAA